MTVQVAARALLYNKFADSGLTGQVFCEDEKKGIVFVSRITVPLVDYTSNHTRVAEELSNAEAGRYFLQLFLPNGNVITKDFEIEPDKETQLVIDLPHEGPHEWTALQALTGQFRHEARQTEGFTRALSKKPKSYAELAENPQKGYALSLLAPEKNAAGGIFIYRQTIPNLSRLIRENLCVKSAMRAFGKSSDVTYPTHEDDDFALFRFAHSGILAEGEHDPDSYNFFHGGQGSSSRHYLLQKSVSGGTLICLPTPWTIPLRYGRQAEVELLLKKNSIAESPDIAMTIGDPMINSVLGYINAGAIHKAAELVDFEKAKRMLWDKVSFPFTAAVGGYLLVFGMDRERYRSASNAWKEWVKNLDHWFEWLPDGAILHAALYFMLGGPDRPDRDEAYEALMRAYDRGLPFFTFGLKLMIDGFRYFTREGDNDAREHLTVLETIANRTDPSQTFLSVTFSQFW